VLGDIFFCNNCTIYFNDAFVILFFLFFEWFEDSFDDTLRQIQLFVICIKTNLLDTAVGKKVQTFRCHKMKLEAYSLTPFALIFYIHMFYPYSLTYH
jgi:hypothetical protein